MRIIDRYIIKQVALATLITASIVTVVVWLTQAMRLIELVLDRGAPVSMLLWMLLLTVPTFLGLIVPLGFAAALMFVYYRLMMESELVVLRAAGLSNWRLARPALLFSLLLVLFGYTMESTIAPLASRELAKEQFIIKNDYALVLLRDGMFNRLKDGMTVYVRERVGTNEMRGILMHDQGLGNDDNGAPKKVETTLFAERGVLEKTPEGSSQLVLLNGLRQEKNKETKQVSELSFKQYAIDMSQFSNNYDDRELEPREELTPELIHSRYTDTRPTIVVRFIAEMHDRLAMPLASLAFAMLTLTILLTAQINRRGMAQRLLVCAVAITLWQVVLMTSVNMIQKNQLFVPLLYLFMVGPMPIMALVLMGRRFCRKGFVREEEVD